MSSSPLLRQVQELIKPKTQGAGPLKVLMLAPEVTPYASVGGVARVLTYLSRALLRLGIDVRIFMPKFGLIDEQRYSMPLAIEGLEVPTDGENGPSHLVCNVKQHVVPGGAPVYFLENQEYYEKRANVYGYSDDAVRWALLSRGSLEFILRFNWTPDVLHAHDWQGAPSIDYLKTHYAHTQALRSVATVYTIHKLSFQGMFDHRNIPELDFDDGRSPLASFFSDRLERQNFMRRGILYADMVNTVSETYSREVLTPEYGEGLDRLLLEVRSKFFGITDGIDYDEFNPATDERIPFQYDLRTLKKREGNKLALQREFGLPLSSRIPILAYEGRLDQDKGLDLIYEIVDPLFRDFEVQLIVMGGGDGRLIELFKQLQKRFPQRVGVHLMPNFTLPRLIFAGADMMLFPSRFEPCGMVQMEGMRYGAIPIARATGGLADTVSDLDIEKDTGTGFIFKDYDRWGLFAQVVRALEIYRQKDAWERLMRRAMEADFSWDHVAKKYLALYQRAIQFHTRERIAQGELPAGIERS